MNNFKQITCPDCGGKGWILKDDPEFGNHRIDCLTCKGQPIYQKLEPIEIPDGYKFEGIFYNQDIGKDFAHFFDPNPYFDKEKSQQFWEFKHIEIPHEVGQIIKEVCDACDRGYVYTGDTCSDTCPSCNGTPEQSYEVTSIAVIKIEGKLYFDVRGVKV